MAQWQHPTQFRHYLQKYPQGDVQFPQVDIEELFKCRYVSLKNAQNPSIKSVYTEDFAERGGQKVWSGEDPIYNASELTLKLRWRSEECGDVQEWSEKFIEYISGRKFEYHDSFRPNKYWQFIFKSEPSIDAERLYGGHQYRYVSFKLNNFGGKPAETSQL